jgi:hypothetical protein
MKINPCDIEWPEPEMVEVMRSKSAAERGAMVADCEVTMRLLLQAHFENLHPEWDDATVKIAVARRFLGAST